LPGGEACGAAATTAIAPAADAHPAAGMHLRIERPPRG
jgi:hypothetical protein